MGVAVVFGACLRECRQQRVHAVDGQVRMLDREPTCAAQEHLAGMCPRQPPGGRQRAHRFGGAPLLAQELGV